MMFFCPKCGMRISVRPQQVFHQVIDGQKVYELWCYSCGLEGEVPRAEDFRLRVFNENILQREKEQW